MFVEGFGEVYWKGEGGIDSPLLSLNSRCLHATHPKTPHLLPHQRSPNNFLGGHVHEEDLFDLFVSRVDLVDVRVDLVVGLMGRKVDGKEGGGGG